MMRADLAMDLMEGAAGLVRGMGGQECPPYERGEFAREEMDGSGRRVVRLSGSAGQLAEWLKQRKGL